MTQNVNELWQNAIAHHHSGRLIEAQQLYLQILKQQPECDAAFHNLGTIACQSEQFAIAIIYYKQALEIDPNRIDTHNDLSQALQEIGNLPEAILHYEKILTLEPDRSDIHYTLGKLLSQQERVEEAIAHYQKAIFIQPNYIQAYLELSDVLVAQNQLKAAREYLQIVIELQPDCADAYWKLCDILSQTNNFSLWRQTAERYMLYCGSSDPERNCTDPVGAAITLIQAYYRTGLPAAALQKLEMLELLIYRDADNLSEQNVERLYFLILFALPHLRDNLEANSKLAKTIGTLYTKSVDRTLAKLSSRRSRFSRDVDLDRSYIHYYLRIGFISTNFRRHPVSWCSTDAIAALAKLTPFLYLYATSVFEEDDRTQLFEKLAARCNWRGDRWQQQKGSNFKNISDLSDLIAEIEQDKLDVLIDLDSLTAGWHPEILRRKPARLCVSWLGFDAPFISPDNYNLGDRHTHPPGIDNYYLETVLRLPDAHTAVAGFSSLPIDVKAKRKSLKIRDKDVVYLCVGPSINWNYATVKAHCRILKSVPHSTLLYKGQGNVNAVKSYYEKACAEIDIANHRIVILSETSSEEEHRNIYVVADILLDSYPFNGSSHTLEALWFDLPVVTRLGEQSFSRIGYSFLTTLRITAGIAHSWDEYVEWGVSLAQFPALRGAIKEQLIQSKQPANLSPLWNPSKFANDMYQLFEEIIAGQMDTDPENYFEMGNRFWQDGNIEEAMRSYRQAIGMQPNYAEAWGKLGTALHGRDKLDEAIAHYQKSLALNPANFAVQSNLARALKSQGDFDAAIAGYQKAIGIDPGDIHPYLELGEIFIECMRFSDALKCFQQVITINPYHAFSHNQLGTVYLQLNQVDRAIQSFQQAIASDPTYSYAHANLGFALLLTGDFIRGFLIYEWRRQHPDISNSPPTFSQPLWDGTDFSGKTLLIYTEPEIGETIQFLRYLPLVRARGGDRARILFDCPKSLNRLCSQLKEISLVDRTNSLPEFNLRFPISSLPRIFGTTLDNIPAASPYLWAPTDSSIEGSDRIAQSSTARLRIGIVWSTCNDSSNMQRKSCSLRIFSHLLSYRKAIFYSLQKEIPSGDIELFNSMVWQIVDLQNHLDDFADAANIIAQMDLVITIDTALAHLAGAMGMPVWVLLPYAPDWRWMLEREDSPWYPSMRLFRQENIDDWQGVISRVVAALEELLWVKK